MPIPSATKITSIVVADAAIAKPSAAPMKGAVHGDAMTTARMPEPKASSARFFDDQPVTPDGASWPNSKTPDRLSASTKNRIASALTTAGDCSWNPQPSCAPAARSKASATPSATNVSTTPAANATASLRIVARVSLCVAKPSTFSVSTGKTHGMRLRIRPPTSADTTAMASVTGSSPVLRAGARLSAGAAAGAALAPAPTLPDTATSIVAARAVPNPPAAVTTPARRSSGPASVGADGQREHERVALARHRLRARRIDLVRDVREEANHAGIGRAGRIGRERELDRRAASRGARRANRRAAREAPRARPQWRRPIADRLRPSRSRAARASGPRLPECRLPCTRANRRAPRERRERRRLNARPGRSSTRCSTSPS